MAKRKRLSPAAALTASEPAPETGSASAPEVKSMSPLRRSPPIAEVAGGAASAAALDEMAQRWQAAREGGRMVVELPLDAVVLDHIDRDRVADDPQEAEILRESLLRRGQQTPIEVVALPGDRYGLLSGWRRCAALRELYEDTGEDRFAVVQALLRQPEDAPAAYMAMIEENEIRANISHFERARIVVRATERGVFETEKLALAGLFASVPRARRSKIGAFLPLVHALDGVLHFPEALTERFGLDLAQALQDRPGLEARLREVLETATPADGAEERRLIDAAMREAPKRLKGRKKTPTPASGSHEAVGKDSVQGDAASPETLAEAEEVALLPGATALTGGPSGRVYRDTEGRVLICGTDEDFARDLVAWMAERSRK